MPSRSIANSLYVLRLQRLKLVSDMFHVLACDSKRFTSKPKRFVKIAFTIGDMEYMECNISGNKKVGNLNTREVK